MRFSSYNILSDRLSGNGYVMLNGLTGALDLISEDFYNFIKENQEPSLNQIEPTLPQDMLKDYYERGFLTDETIEEEIEYAKLFAKKIDLIDDSHNIVIVPNLNCNYRCIYCYESGTQYFSNSSDYLISKGQVDTIFDFIRENHVTKDIGLFGGEPLNKNNMEIIDYIMTKAEETNSSFYAITNGHDLEHFMPYLKSNQINSLQITVDGPKHIHDKRRISLAKDSSFEKIFKNIKEAMQIQNLSINLRINVDNRNLPYLEELMEYLKDANLFDSEQVYVYAEKVTGLEKSFMDESEITSELEKLNNKFPKFTVDLETEKIKTDLEKALLLGLPLERAHVYCGGLGKMLVFSPDGLIYSCWRYLGISNEAIGKYNSNGEIKWIEEKHRFLSQYKTYNNETCIKCPYALICRGGCLKLALDAGLNYSPRHCHLYKTKFKAILAQVAEDHIRKLETSN